MSIYNSVQADFRIILIDQNPETLKFLAWFKANGSFNEDFELSINEDDELELAQHNPLFSADALFIMFENAMKTKVSLVSSKLN